MSENFSTVKKSDINDVISSIINAKVVPVLENQSQEQIIEGLEERLAGAKKRFELKGQQFGLSDAATLQEINGKEIANSITRILSENNIQLSGRSLNEFEKLVLKLGAEDNIKLGKEDFTRFTSSLPVQVKDKISSLIPE